MRSRRVVLTLSSAACLVAAVKQCKCCELPYILGSVLIIHDSDARRLHHHLHL
jgi:hypothetical protein